MTTRIVRVLRQVSSGIKGATQVSVVVVEIARLPITPGRGGDRDLRRRQSIDGARDRDGDPVLDLVDKTTCAIVVGLRDIACGVDLVYETPGKVVYVAGDLVRCPTDRRWECRHQRVDGDGCRVAGTIHQRRKRR